MARLDDRHYDPHLEGVGELLLILAGVFAGLVVAAVGAAVYLLT